MPDKNRQDECRHFAETCSKLALNNKDRPTRAMFLAMAQVWNSLADSPFGGHGQHS